MRNLTADFSTPQPETPRSDKIAARSARRRLALSVVASTALHLVVASILSPEIYLRGLKHPELKTIRHSGPLLVKLQAPKKADADHAPVIAATPTVASVAASGEQTGTDTGMPAGTPTTTIDAGVSAYSGRSGALDSPATLLEGPDMAKFSRMPIARRLLARIRINIGPTGVVEGIDFIETDPLPAEALNTIQSEFGKMKFTPAVRDGQAVRSSKEIGITLEPAE